MKILFLNKRNHSEGALEKINKFDYIKIKFLYGKRKTTINKAKKL